MDINKRMIPQSRESQIRDEEKRKLQLQQQSTMDSWRVNKDYNDAQNVNGAFDDKYMRGAYEKVRQNPTTHSDSLTRFNGTYMFNKSLKKD